MKAWFGPQAGTNTGTNTVSHGVWRGYDAMPVTWKGWLATLAYVVFQMAALFAMAPLLDALDGPVVVLVVQVALIHLLWLWGTSRHTVSAAGTDPSLLPADVRDP